MTNRHKRHKPSQCVTCAGQFYRHKRHTPLKGVTDVTLADLLGRFLEVVTDWSSTGPVDEQPRPSWPHLVRTRKHFGPWMVDHCGRLIRALCAAPALGSIRLIGSRPDHHLPNKLCHAGELRREDLTNG